VSAVGANLLALVSRHRGLLAATLLDQLRQRYAGTTAGLLWVVLYPATLIGLYSVLYLYVFRIQLPGVEPVAYAMRIISGLVVVVGFNEALNAGANSLASNRNLLLNAVFPSELIPLRAVLAAQGTIVFGLAVCAALSLVLGLANWPLLLLPVFWLLLVAFAIGISWVLALAGLVLRDVQQVIVFFTMALLIGSPIAYTPEMAPGPLKLLVYLNPLSYFVLPIQELCVNNRAPDPVLSAVALALGVVSLIVGFAVFRRAKAYVLDNV
jgi:homopolymeric O-antigen transport system permease protein